MSRNETVTLMNMCMIRDGARVVVIDRKNPDWPGVTFPGGHVEPGESFSEAVIREVREETGLEITAPRLCGVKHWRHRGVHSIVFLYTADRFTGALASSEEGEVWWTELSALGTLPLADDMLTLLRVFTEDQLSEFYYRPTGEDWLIELS